MPLFRTDIRASDADRESVAEFLKGHYAAGRLTQDELDARVESAYAAVGLGQLERLTADLPALPAAPPARRGAARPALTVLALAVLAVALASALPGEAWAGLAVIALPLLLFAGLAFALLAPLAVPLALLAGLVYVVRRAAAPAPLSGVAPRAPLPGSASRRRLS